MTSNETDVSNSICNAAAMRELERVRKIAAKQEARAAAVLDELVHGCPDPFVGDAEAWNVEYLAHKARLKKIIATNLDEESISEFVSLTYQLRDSSKARRRAINQHYAGPKQAAKQHVFDCWIRWQKNRHEYRSKSAFARAMLDKYDALGSQRVIERWCKEWESEPS
ncbi:hypothetical protein [Ottowia thiooxydans]|uniref:hypothetical protein n=1 Tax=Ottowia thiooxydans TaxID=219182 RepID=UPI0012EC7D3C|nr:hypothetical protein [Ottowia thiooxydans]